jgi:menaquinone-specific isochorismate synthase
VSGGLRSTTTPADLDPGDPSPGTALTAFASPRRTLWGEGEALRIDLPAPWPDHVDRVAEALAAIDVDGTVGEPGTGPVAFGALPYDRDAAATLVVPRVLHGRTADGHRWTTVTATGHATDSAAPDPGDRDLPAVPAAVSVRSVRPPGDWRRAVAEATERIVRRELTKVVLARELEVVGDVPWDAATLWARFSAAAPGALRYAVDGSVGASPELLVSRIGDVVRAHPMAGTTPRTGDPDADQRRAAELLASTKNRTEHQITIDMVHETLLPWCSYLDAEPTPSVVAAGPVQHLATLVEGRLARPTPSVLTLVAALHPTPAVGGWPTDAALAAQRDLEGADRGRYAGPVGWVDAAGNGAWAVGLRGVQLDGRRASCFAGVGVVADSDPDAELEETRAKAQAVLSALVRL